MYSMNLFLFIIYIQKEVQMLYKESMATHKRNCMLGQLEILKEMANEMEVKLSDLKKVLNNKQL